MNPRKSKAWLSLPEAARALRLPQGRVLALIHAHQLEARLAEAGCWWISRDALERFRAAQRTADGGRAA